MPREDLVEGTDGFCSERDKCCNFDPEYCTAGTKCTYGPMTEDEIYAGSAQSDASYVKMMIRVRRR